MTHRSFQLASGSLIGRDHRQVSKNCQDGFHIVRDDACTIGIVTDGCGSGTHSEVGAKLGARLLAENIRTEVRQDSAGVNWPRVRQHTLSAIDVLATQMGGPYRQTIEDYFLFTAVGTVLTDGTATFFALGDGVTIVNGEQHQLGPFPGNAPPYLGYGLVREALCDASLGDQPIEVIAEVPTAELEHFLIGTDGVLDLIEAADETQPGTDKPVGDISQFWTDDTVFRNPDIATRRLRLIGRDWPRHDPEPGRLPDDTTLVVGRREPTI